MPPIYLDFQNVHIILVLGIQGRGIDTQTDRDGVQYVMRPLRK